MACILCHFWLSRLPSIFIKWMILIPRFQNMGAHCGSQHVLLVNIYIFIYIYTVSAGGKIWCNMQQKSLKKNRKGHLQICMSRKFVSFSPFWVDGTKNPPETQQRWLPRSLGCYSLLEPLQASQVAFQWTAQLCWGVGSCGGLLGRGKAFWISIESKISWDLSRFKFVFPLECLNFIRIRSERARKKAPLEPYKNVPPKLSEFNLYV